MDTGMKVSILNDVLKIKYSNSGNENVHMYSFQYKQESIFKQINLHVKYYHPDYIMLS